MATNTYTALYTTTVSGTSTNSITFSSIPSTYTDLVIVSSFQHSTDGACYVRVNSDSGSNYSRTSVTGDGSSAGSERASNQTYSRIAQTGANVDNLTITQFMNYSNATTYKTFLNRWNRPSAYVFADVNLWRSTSAISSIEITHSNGGYFTAGSTFTVYGIASADNFTKATGGTLYEDSTYWYHVFGASGTFTPKQSLTADVLVIAGGGGGGGQGGGGGAGGLRYFTSQALTTATSYTITVGAGGNGGVGGTIDYDTKGTSGSNSSFSSNSSAGGGGGGSLGTYAGVDAVKYGIAGGSGGGSASHDSNIASPGGAGNTPSVSPVQGYSGGIGAGSGGTSGGGGGGGGANGAGSNSPNYRSGGNGGVGLSGASVSLLNEIGAATGTGELSGGNYYYAGGGGGSGRYYSGGASGTGGLGGGGNGGVNYSLGQNVDGFAGRAYTGGGGGSGVNGGKGGSGLVVVRYAK